MRTAAAAAGVNGNGVVTGEERGDLLCILYCTELLVGFSQGKKRVTEDCNFLCFSSNKEN